MRNYIALFVLVVSAFVILGCGSEAPTPAISTLDLIQGEMEKQGLSSYFEVDTLFFNRTGITDLEGIQKCKNLRVLVIRGNNIESFAPLVGLNNLEVLNVSCNNLTSENLQYLGELKNLKSFRAAENKITDISALSKLTELRILELSHNNITDLIPLSKMEKLHTLFLDNNNITSVYPLEKLELLHWLSLSGNEDFNDVTPLKSMLPLKSLLDFGPLLEVQNIGLTEEQVLSQLGLTQEEAEELHVEY